MCWLFSRCIIISYVISVILIVVDIVVVLLFVNIVIGDNKIFKKFFSRLKSEKNFLIQSIG